MIERCYSFHSCYKIGISLFQTAFFGEVPKTKAVSLFGILEILLKVRPFVKENTQIFALIIAIIKISMIEIIDFNALSMILNVNILEKY